MKDILASREIKGGIIIPIEREFTVSKKEDEKPKIMRVTDNYIDISYLYSDTASKVLSNLYPYNFRLEKTGGRFSGKGVASSIEAVIQSLRYNDISKKTYCLSYSGKDAYHLRGLKPDEWKKDGMLYWFSNGSKDIREINRYTEDYQLLLDYIYLAAFNNPIFRDNLIDSFPKELEHDGRDNKSDTLLTRTEYLSRLYALRYIVNGEKEVYESYRTLKRVRDELEG